MAVGKRNFEFTKGDDFITTVFLQNPDETPIDITGRTYASQVRRIAASTGTPDAAFVCVVTDGPGGEITMTLPNTQTINLDGDYFYDLQQTNAGVITTLMGGKIRVVQDVTK